MINPKLEFDEFLDDALMSDVELDVSSNLCISALLSDREWNNKITKLCTSSSWEKYSNYMKEIILAAEEVLLGR